VPTFLAAVELAAEAQTVGAEYVAAILAQPQALQRNVRSAEPFTLPATLALPQPVVSRELAEYEQYVANRALVTAGGA
jgi:hypothetical protein